MKIEVSSANKERWVFLVGDRSLIYMLNRGVLNQYTCGTPGFNLRISGIQGKSLFMGEGGKWY